MDLRNATAQVQTLLWSEDPFVRDRLSYGSFIGARYPYFYLETPKAACTATKVVLWRLEGLGPVPVDLTGVHHRALADYVPYDHVVRTDDYARGMVKVLNAVGVPTHRWPPLGERRNDTESHRSVTVSESAAERIRSAYAADYELLDRVAAQPRRRPVDLR